MISFAMSQSPPVRFNIPPEFTQSHHDALVAYLTDSRGLGTDKWRLVYEGIDLLAEAQVSDQAATRTFRQIYDELIGDPLANQFIEQLLETSEIVKESPQITATFARQISRILRKTGFLQREIPLSVLLYGYCLYWWQSFSRGYAFEVYIMRDLKDANIEFQMHDIRRQRGRLSPADLIVLDLLGDIKTSIYFLQSKIRGQLQNDFYITRLYAKGRERTLIVFQKRHAWDAIDGGKAIPGTLETILDLLPTPIQIERCGIMFVVVDYESWKKMVRKKQQVKDVKYV